MSRVVGCIFGSIQHGTGGEHPQRLELGQCILLFVWVLSGGRNGGPLGDNPHACDS